MRAVVPTPDAVLARGSIVSWMRPPITSTAGLDLTQVLS